VAAAALVVGDENAADDRRKWRWSWRVGVGEKGDALVEWQRAENADNGGMSSGCVA